MQLAWSVFGANPVVTAATGPDIELALSLGATDVVVYLQENLFDTLANNSVDVTIWASQEPRTRRCECCDRGMRGPFSPNNKAGVTQVNFGLMQSITADSKNTQSFNLADTPLRSPDTLTPRSTWLAHRAWKA